MTHLKQNKSVPKCVKIDTKKDRPQMCHLNVSHKWDEKDEANEKNYNYINFI